MAVGFECENLKQRKEFSDRLVKEDRFTFKKFIKVALIPLVERGLLMALLMIYYKSIRKIS